MRKRLLLYILVFAAIASCIQSCKKNTGILYKIFSLGHKTYEPLEKAQEAVFAPLAGDYMLANERPMRITIRDARNYEIKFLPAWLSEDQKILSGHVTTLNKKKYLNVYTDDDNYLLFRIDSLRDSVILLLLTHKVMHYTKGATLKEYLKTDGAFPDTGNVLFKIPMEKMKEGAAEDWSKGKLQPQIRDIASYYKYEKVFPKDSSLARLKKEAIFKTLSKTNNVAAINNLVRQFPEIREDAKARAKLVCTTTQNCLDYISCFPEDAIRDSTVDKAFRTAKTEADYRALIAKFPDNRKIPSVMMRLYFEEKSRCKNIQEEEALAKKYPDQPLMLKVIKAAQEFGKLPFDEIKFNTSSWILTKESPGKLEKILLFISEANRDKNIISDVYVSVNCKIVPSIEPKCGKINFRHSLNRMVSIKKIISANPPKNVRFHYIPAGQAPGNDTISDGSVKFILSAKQADELKARFVKLCFAWKKDFVVPDASGEYISDTYVREPELENYICNVMAERLLLDKKANFKIIPPNFWYPQFAKDLPEFDLVRAGFFDCLDEKKLRRKKPADYVIELK
jgi:hypothetical protein